MFAASTVMVINKIDLLPYVDYDLATVKKFALAVNPHLQIFELSSRTGEGLDAWCEWLQSMGRKGKRASSLAQRVEL
ncbi:hypothetical protein KDW_52830 [Dictyobacter vulcani]|uniref:Uncharacterized protein n=2 Tax=Dictyobacter vulcani TaxID=2607529 RepID=A0A5J4KXC6_9CHLR|nr:hypothetical protein KDW_52830 [Dictyobacter vulcani]